MYVSLCGPHSFETSTFGPAWSPFDPVHVSGPFAARYSYLFHHVGLSGLLVCAAAGDAKTVSSIVAAPAAANLETIRVTSPGRSGLYVCTVINEPLESALTRTSTP